MPSKFVQHAGYPLRDEFVAFIMERSYILARKEIGEKPLTKDSILATYRFCNVHREDDRVTKWIAENWRFPHRADKHLWFAMVVARLFNKIDTLAEIGYPVPFRIEALRKKLQARKARGVLVFNPAYVVSTNGVAGDKIDYLLDRVLTPLWTNRDLIVPRSSTPDTLADFHARLMVHDGMGSFMAAQVVADMKYVAPLRDAADWQTFASSGPGSRRGLNRVMGTDPEAGWRKGAWEDALAGLAAAVRNPLKMKGVELHNQDLQNCLCEFDKYRRAVEGGAPKQFYRPYEGSENEI